MRATCQDLIETRKSVIQTLASVVQHTQKFVQADKLGQRVRNQDISDWLAKDISLSDVS